MLHDLAESIRSLSEQSQGEKVTIYSRSMLGYVKTEGFLGCADPGGNTLRFTPKGKRKERVLMSYYSPSWYVFKGWGHPEPPESMGPEEVVGDPEQGLTVQKGRHSAMSQEWDTEFAEFAKKLGKPWATRLDRRFDPGQDFPVCAKESLDEQVAYSPEVDKLRNKAEADLNYLVGVAKGVNPADFRDATVLIRRLPFLIGTVSELANAVIATSDSKELANAAFSQFNNVGHGAKAARRIAMDYAKALADWEDPIRVRRTSRLRDLRSYLGDASYLLRSLGDDDTTPGVALLRLGRAVYLLAQAIYDLPGRTGNALPEVYGTTNPDRNAKMDARLKDLNALGDTLFQNLAALVDATEIAQRAGVAAKKIDVKVVGEDFTQRSAYDKMRDAVRAEVRRGLGGYGIEKTAEMFFDWIWGGLVSNQGKFALLDLGKPKFVFKNKDESSFTADVRLKLFPAEQVVTAEYQWNMVNGKYSGAFKTVSKASDTKLKLGDVIEVQGFVMLKGMDDGDHFVVKEIGSSYGDTYLLVGTKGTKRRVRFYTDQVDRWVKPKNDSDLNKIVVM